MYDSSALQALIDLTEFVRAKGIQLPHIGDYMRISVGILTVRRGSDFLYLPQSVAGLAHMKQLGEYVDRRTPHRSYVAGGRIINPFLTLGTLRISPSPRSTRHLSIHWYLFGRI